MRRALMILSTSLALTGVAHAIDAGSAAARPGELANLDDGLRGLPLGDSREALLAWVKARIDRKHLPTVAAATDFAEKERRKGVRDLEFQEFAAGEVRFDGTPSPWRSGIVSGEFKDGADESLLVWREPGETHFFFLSAGQFWRYGRQLDLATPFDARAEDLSRRLGAKPVLSEGKEDAARAAVWEGARHRVRLSDRRLLYGGDLLIVEDPKLAEAVATRRASARASATKDAAEADPLGDFLLSDDER